MSHEPTTSQEPTTAEPASPEAFTYPPVQNDPFPRMILACFAITAVLMVLILSIILYDFIDRRKNSGQVAPGAPVVGLPQQFPAQK